MVCQPQVMARLLAASVAIRLVPIMKLETWLNFPFGNDFSAALLLEFWHGVQAVSLPP